MGRSEVSTSVVKQSEA